MTAISRYSVLLFLAFLGFASCSKFTGPHMGCLQQQIKEIQAQEKTNPPAQIWQWKVDGKIYYHVITFKCCDIPTTLYDDQCNYICAPDGGISGHGDGRCPKFKDSVQETLIWEDRR